MSSQIEMVSLEDLVSKTHQYRKFAEIFDFSTITPTLKSAEKEASYKGYGVLRLFKCLLLQFMEDLSDRELQRFLQENNAGKWFCNFSLTERTPDFSVFSRLRKRIGTKKLSKVFAILRDQMRAKGYISEVFTFIDASALIAKASLWQERDKAIKLKYEKLNNESLPDVADLRMVRIAFPGDSLTTLFFKERTLHGFEGVNVGAISFHWTDKDEARATGIPEHMLTDKDVMGSLTKIPDQSRIRIIESTSYENALKLQKGISYLHDR